MALFYMYYYTIGFLIHFPLSVSYSLFPLYLLIYYSLLLFFILIHFSFLSHFSLLRYAFFPFTFFSSLLQIISLICIYLYLSICTVCFWFWVLSCSFCVCILYYWPYLLIQYFCDSFCLVDLY